MARVALLTHLDDAFDERRFLAAELVEAWRAQAHDVRVVAGLEQLPDADVALVHVDLSVVPDPYLQAARRYPRSINAGSCDLRKRVVSQQLVTRGDAWDGPVVVKTDLNAGGVPELHHVRRAKAAGRVPDPALGAFAVMESAYPVFDSLSRVPVEVWDQPSLVVERFLPERDPGGFALRAWVFLGPRERCTRYVGPRPIVKAADVISREPVDVPEALRAERARLGLDYGKIDFVVHDGHAILLDANRTPTAPPRVAGAPSLSSVELARGLDAWVRA